MTVTKTQDCFINALSCQNHSGVPPIWLMRQAGRYLPEYQLLRGKHSFLTLCHTPELAMEVTLLPIKRFGFDAAILFSDILVLPEAYGLGLRFEEQKGPILEHPVEDFTALPSIDVEESLGFVEQTVRFIKQEHEGALIGFSGGPFTLASYMIEGGSSQTFQKTKRRMFKDPESFHFLLQKITDDIIRYVAMQERAGVDVVQIFESWAHLLSDFHFQNFIIPYLKQIVEATSVPVILFCRGSSVFAPLLAKINPSAISLDWQCNLSHVRKIVPKTIALQGNFDPDLLLAPSQVVREQARLLVASMEKDPGYIFNLGHGILPTTPLDSVYALIEAVKSNA